MRHLTIGEFTSIKESASLLGMMSFLVETPMKGSLYAEDAELILDYIKEKFYEELKFPFAGMTAMGYITTLEQLRELIAPGEMAKMHLKLSGADSEFKMEIYKYIVNEYKKGV